LTNTSADDNYTPQLRRTVSCPEQGCETMSMSHRRLSSHFHLFSNALNFASVDT